MYGTDQGRQFTPFISRLREVPPKEHLTWDTLWAPASSASGPPSSSASWRSCLLGPFKSWQAWEQHSFLTQEDVMVQMSFYFIRLHLLWKPVHVLQSQAKTRIKDFFLPLLHGGGWSGVGRKVERVRCTCSPWMMIIFKDSDGNRPCYYAHHYQYNQSLVQLSNLFLTTKLRLIVKLEKQLRN